MFEKDKMDTAKMLNDIHAKKYNKNLSGYYLFFAIAFVIAGITGTIITKDITLTLTTLAFAVLFFVLWIVFKPKKDKKTQ